MTVQPQYYPPQFPVAQQPYAYPAQYPPAPAGYPQQYPQPYAPPAPPAAPLPAGTLDEFYDQPSGGGGPSFKFMDANRNPLIGKTYVGQVERVVTNGDIRAQTDQSGRVQTFKDGRPKFVMIVPMVVQPSSEFPDGRAGWWVKGQARDELARAMAEVGAPTGPPEPGAVIQVTLVGTRPVPGMSPAYQYRVEYRRPAGAPPAPVVPVQQAQQSYAPPAQQPYAAPAMYPVPVEASGIAFGAVPAQQAYAPPAPAASGPAFGAAPAQPAPPQQMPAGLDPQQQALWARLTGQPAPAAS